MNRMLFVFVMIAMQTIFSLHTWAQDDPRVDDLAARLTQMESQFASQLNSMNTLNTQYKALDDLSKTQHAQIQNLTKSLDEQQTLNEQQRNLILSLQNELLTVKSDNTNLQKGITDNNRTRYQIMYNAIYTGLEQGDKLSQEFKSLQQNFKKDRLFTRLLNASNPTSGELGFNLIDIIKEQSVKVFGSKLQGDDKQRWLDMVAGFFQNDITQNVLAINPVSATISSVISMALTFTTVNGSVVKSAGSPFKEADIKEFIGKVNQYLNVYVELNNVTEHFQIKMETLYNENTPVIDRGQLFYSQLITMLSLSPSGSVTTQFRTKYEVKGTDYSTFINDLTFINAADFCSDEYIALVEDKENIKKKYLTIWSEFLDEYLNSVGALRGLDGVKTNQLNKFIKDIETEKAGLSI